MSDGDARTQYFAMKKAFQILYDQGEVTLAKELARARTGRGYEISQCARGSMFLWDEGKSEKPTVRAWAMLAHDIVRWRNDLPALGYPEVTWRPLLTKFEDDKMAELSRGGSNAATRDARVDGYAGQAAFGAQLVKALDEYRARSTERPPKATYDPGCGAGEIRVNIRTNPPGARVVFIPAFYYHLCRSQNINPDDPRTCDHWRDQPDGTLAAVAGDYFYFARWPDGVTTGRGRLQFRADQEGSTIILRP
jgi:hypothetical protein